MLRVTDQIVNPRQALLPEAEGWGQWWLSRVDNLICHPQHRAWLFLLHRKSIVHLPCLSLYFRPICKTQGIEHELVHGFSNNSLPCKQMTTFSPLLLVSTQLVNVPLLIQNEFAAKNTGKFWPKSQDWTLELHQNYHWWSFSTRSYNRTPWGESPSITRREWQREIDQIISRQTLLWYTEEI